MPAAGNEGAPKPFPKLTPEEVSRLPTIQEQWRHAFRNYSRYTGYAWSAALMTAAVACAASYATGGTVREYLGSGVRGEAPKR